MLYYPFKSSRCTKTSFRISEKWLNFTHLEGLERFLSWNCSIITTYFFHLPPTSSHLHSLQVENCDSNSRLVVDEDDNGKLMFEKVKTVCAEIVTTLLGFPNSTPWYKYVYHFRNKENNSIFLRLSSPKCNCSWEYSCRTFFYHDYTI